MELDEDAADCHLCPASPFDVIAFDLDLLVPMVFLMPAKYAT